MPVITLRYDDLEKLVGADKDPILKQIPMIGADIERIEDEYADVEFFPDRPDLFSVEGVARAMRGFLGIETGLCKYDVKKSNISITIEKSVKPIRPCLTCAVVRGLHLDPGSIESLMTLQEDLHWGLGRDRKKISIGVHDISKVEPPFVYKAVDASMEFVPLDFDKKMSMRAILEKHPKGVQFAHILEGAKRYPLIADAKNNVLSFPPIINGALTAVTEETTDVFVEVTGIDASVAMALNIVVTALAERGAKIESVEIASDGKSVVTPNLSPTSRKLSVSEVNSLLGIALNAGQIARELEKMRFGAVARGETIDVAIPAYRADILHNWDLIEDIAIGYGFDKFKPELPETPTIGKTHPIEDKLALLREIMVGLGFFEITTFTLTNERVHFDMMNRPRAKATKVRHPISEEHTMIRSILLPNLMSVLSQNKHVEMPQRIFEVGDVIIDSKDVQKLAGVSTHSAANFAEIKSIVDVVLRELGLEYEIIESDDTAFLEGRRASILIRRRNIGVFGEIHPDVILNFGLDHPVVAFEMEIR
ncbi:MAG: phenylalanine--tRNA ligase subunit beta [Methanocellales archaeon]|nr:phenylalanine--tRNA ligase subunit beta [Methanocellales archaeon]